MLVNTFLKIFLSFFTSFFTALNSFKKVGKIGYFTITILFGGVACFFGTSRELGSSDRDSRSGVLRTPSPTVGVVRLRISYRRCIAFIHLIHRGAVPLPLQGSNPFVASDISPRRGITSRGRLVFVLPHRGITSRGRLLWGAFCLRFSWVRAD